MEAENVFHVNCSACLEDFWFCGLIRMEIKQEINVEQEGEENEEVKQWTTKWD